MKLPFPYTVAAELILFMPPPKKLTGFHLLVMMAFVVPGPIVFKVLVDRVGMLWAIGAAAAICWVAGCSVNVITLKVLSVVRFLVRKGWMASPEPKRLVKCIYWQRGSTEPATAEYESLIAALDRLFAE